MQRILEGGSIHFTISTSHAESVSKRLSSCPSNLQHWRNQICYWAREKNLLFIPSLTGFHQGHNGAMTSKFLNFMCMRNTPESTSSLLQDRSYISPPKALCLYKVFITYLCFQTIESDLLRPTVNVRRPTNSKTEGRKHKTASPKLNIDKLVRTVDVNSRIVALHLASELKRSCCICMCSSLLGHNFSAKTGSSMGQCHFLPYWNYYSFHPVCMRASVLNNNYLKQSH